MRMTSDDLASYEKNGWNAMHTGYELSYKGRWDNSWFVIREFFQNAMDEHDVAGIPLLPKIYRNGNDLIIEDSGRGVGAEALLLREVKRGSGLRGAFGEGLKWASLCALRLGYDIRIESPYVEIIPVVVSSRFGKKNEMYDLVVFLWREKQNSDSVGTKITINNYDEGMYKNRFFVFARDVKERFSVTKDMDGYSRVSSIMLPSVGSLANCLYVGDIFVKNIGEGKSFISRFSYNVWNVNLDPDRMQVAEDGDLSTRISGLWSECDNSTLISELFRAINAGEWESKIYWDYWSNKIKNCDVWKSAWDEAFGTNAVLKTDIKYSSWAAANNYNVIKDFPSSLIKLLSGIVPTDADVRMKFAKSLEEKITCIEDCELGEYRLDSLHVLRWVIGRMGQYTRAIDNNKWQFLSIVAADIPSIDGNCVKGATKDNNIFISPLVLDDVFDSLAVLCHELAHVAGSYEGTLGQLWNTEGLSMAMFKTILTNRDDEIWRKVHV